MNTVTTLPTGSEERKNVPMFRGLLGYFPAALMGVAQLSKKGNDKHNPGEEMHHARGKSGDHADCIIRHLMDIADIKAEDARGYVVNPDQLLEEVNALCWRALALSQEVYESLGAPLAPGARYPETPRFDMEEAIANGLLGAGAVATAENGLAGFQCAGSGVAGSAEALDNIQNAGLAGLLDTGTPGIEVVEGPVEDLTL